MNLHIGAKDTRTQARDPIVTIGPGDVPAPLLLAGTAASEHAVRIDLRIPALGVIERREARAGIAVLIDRPVAVGKIIARDIAESTFFISGLKPELVARRDIIGVQLKAALDREAIGIAGQGRESIGWRGTRNCSRRCGESRGPEKAGIDLMRRRRQLHRAPWLIVAEISDNFRYPGARRLGLERGRGNTPYVDWCRGLARDRAADRGAPVRLVLKGERSRETVAEGRRIGK